VQIEWEAEIDPTIFCLLSKRKKMKIYRLSTLAVVMSCFIGLYGCAPESSSNSSTAGSGVLAGPSQELLNNGNFTKGSEGWWTAGATLAVDNQMGCATFANSGANPWDVILGQSGLSLVKGQTYTLHFNARAKKNVHIKALIQHDGAPYTSYIVQDIALNDTAKPFDIKFTPSASDEKTQLQFQMGTQAPTTVCVGDVSLVGPSFHKKSDLATVRVNQVGYLTKEQPLPAIPKLLSSGTC
jgi:endoglucanase